MARVVATEKKRVRAVGLAFGSGNEVACGEEVSEAAERGEFDERLGQVIGEFAHAIDDCLGQDLPVVVKSRLDALKKLLENFWI